MCIANNAHYPFFRVSSSYNLHRRTRNLLGEPRTHIKLALFGAAMNALAFLFMDIYALVLDNPESRFGTKNDIRNTLLHLIIIFTSVSTLSLLISAWITYFQQQASDFELPSTTPAQRVWNGIEEGPSLSGEHPSINLKSP
ncbi:hypothetical protein BJ912DRAFT_649122 [Pholiota molesta]|nr:hypothetical protein BJ912DRAFT_649122 [Pholiota molesta]